MVTLTFDVLRQQVRGDVIAADDEGYEQARAVYNAMIDKRPVVVTRPVNAGDVIAAVNFARESRLPIAIRGGGHSVPGFGTVDGGVVIDLSRMRGVRVNPEKRTARAEGGATWGDFNAATNAFGLATTGGIISTTGVAGLTIGGGIGYLARGFGLSLDNLASADVVTADGRFLVASDSENQDLFWAVRGGGGNFGVVTSFTFRLHSVGTVVVGVTLWPIEQTPEVLRWYREFLPQAQEDLYGFFAVLVVPPGPPFPEEIHLKKMCGVVWCYAGDPDEQDAAFAPVRGVGTPAFHFAAPMPYPALQSMFDGLIPAGLQWYWRGDFFDEITDGAIEAHLEYGSSNPTALSTMHLYPIDGAAHRVGRQET